MKSFKLILSIIAMCFNDILIAQENNESIPKTQKTLHKHHPSIILNKKEPIYIVDNIEVDEDYINGLLPYTIKSIYVLNGEKGRSSYGTSGKAGVIIIKTR